MQKPAWNLIDNTPVGIFFIDKNGDCAYVNQTWCQITDLSLEEIKQHDWLQAIHPSDRSEYQTAWQSAFENWLPFTKNHRFVLPNGSIIFVTTQSFPVGKKGGVDSGYIGTVTKQSNPIVQPGTTKQNNKHSIQIGAIQPPHLKILSKGDIPAVTSEELLTPLPPTDACWQALNAVLSDAIYTINKKNTILLASNHFLPSPTNNIVGANILDILPKDTHLKHLEKMEFALQRKETQSYAFLTVDADGDAVWLTSHLAPIIEDEQCHHVLLRMSHPTNYQQKTPPSQQDHTILSTVTNQLNYAVSSINSYASRSLSRLANNQLTTEELTHLQQAIVQQADSIEETLYNIKHVFIKPPQKKTRCDLNQLITRLCEQRITSSHPQILVDLRLDKQLPGLTTDKDRLRYALQQLLDNAVEACNKTTQPKITIHTHLKGDQLILSISDNGIGIADCDLYLIFEPFFSTKRKQGGLGLSMSRLIIEQWQGSLQAFNNTPGTGATFQLTLPTIATR